MIADGLLAPKKVRVKLDDVTVAEAVDQLAKLSGYQIELGSDAAAKRKVTLNTGEVTFNEALDALCQKAQTRPEPHLVESEGEKGAQRPLRDGKGRTGSDRPARRRAGRRAGRLRRVGAPCRHCRWR